MCAAVEEQPPAEDDSPDVVLLVHGIRTQAAWEDLVGQVIARGTGATVFPIKYGYFDLLKFLSPIATRSGPIERLLRELRGIRERKPDVKISVVAHSFGTFAISEILQTDPNVRLHRLILCGSIIPRGYYWDLVSSRVEAKSNLDSPAIVNDCGTKDVWPVFAEKMTFGYGASGTFGFGTNRVADRFHATLHSGYFDKKFVEDYWVSFLTTGKVKPTALGESVRRYSLPVVIADWVPFKLIFALAFAAAATFGVLRFRRNRAFANLQPIATIAGPRIQFDTTVQHPAGLAAGPGMVLHVPGYILHASGKNVQLVVHFFHGDNTPVVANPQEPSFHDVNGLVATGTKVIPIPVDSMELSDYPIAIPYYALNLTNTNRTATNALQAVAAVFVNNSPIAQSPPTAFRVTY